MAELPFTPLMQDTDVVGMPTPTLFGGERLRGDVSEPGSNTASAITAIADKSASGEGFWPTTLAVLAALSGQFGPAIALQEQKRKTQLSKELLPVMSQVNTLINSGKWEDAIGHLQNATAAVGPRAPELLPVLQEAIKRASNKQSEWEHAKSMADVMDKAVPKEHPDRQAVDVFKAAVKARSPMSEQFASNFFSSLTPHTQNMDGQNLQTGRIGGKTVSTPLPTVAQESDLKGWVGERLAAETGLTVQQLTNLRNGIAVPDPVTGENLTAKPGAVADINTRLTQLQGKQAAMDMALKLPIDPIMNSALLRGGLTPEQIATREISSDAIDKANTYIANRLREQEYSKGMAEFDKPAVAMSKPQAVYDRETGMEIAGASMNDAARNSNRVSTADRDVYRKEILPVYRLRNKLSMMDAITESLPDINSTFDRLEQGIKRTLNLRFGFDEKTTQEQTLQIALKGIIEDYANAKGVSASRYDFLTRQLTGAFADKQGAQAVIGQIKELISSDLQQYSQQAMPTDSTEMPSGDQKKALSYSIADKAAQRYGVPIDVSRAVLTRESGGNATAPHRAGDGYGPMQITHNRGANGQPSTADIISAATGFPVDKILHDQETNITAGNYWLSELIKRNGGNVRNAVRDYNGSGVKAEKYADEVMQSAGLYKKQSAARVLAPVVAPVQQGTGIVSPPTRLSTPEQDAAYRQQQGGVVPVSSTTTAPTSIKLKSKKGIEVY